MITRLPVSAILPAGAPVIVLSKWSIAPNVEWFKARFGDRGTVITRYNPALPADVGLFVFLPDGAIPARLLYADLFNAGAIAAVIYSTAELAATDWGAVLAIESGAESAESFFGAIAEIAQGTVSTAGTMASVSAWTIRNLPVIAGVVIGAGVLGFLGWYLSRSKPVTAAGVAAGGAMGGITAAQAAEGAAIAAATV